LGLSVAGLYLYNNYLETGYLTGGPRILASETNVVLFKSLVKATIKEFNLVGDRELFFPEVFFQAGIFIYFLKKVKNYIFGDVKVQNANPIWKVFLFVGAIYFICLVTTRWLRYYDLFGLRLLGPATFLFLLAVINYIDSRYERPVLENFKRFLLVVLLASYSFNVLGKNLANVIQGEDKYHQTLERIKEKYSFIPPNSIVVFSEIHLNYIRPDIRRVKPTSKSNFPKKEKIGEFLERVKGYPQEDIYFEIPKEELGPERFDYSVIEFVRKNKGKNFIKIR
jgi:hypothetical protein